MLCVIDMHDIQSVCVCVFAGQLSDQELPCRHHRSCERNGQFSGPTYSEDLATPQLITNAFTEHTVD